MPLRRVVLLRGFFYLRSLITWAARWRIPDWAGSRGNPWLRGEVRNGLRCGLEGTPLSVPSAARRGRASGLRCGCRMPGLSRSIRPHTQCRASSNCNVWRVHPARFLVAAVLPHHLCVHSSGRNTDHIWPHHRRPGFLR